MTGPNPGVVRNISSSFLILTKAAECKTEAVVWLCSRQVVCQLWGKHVAGGAKWGAHACCPPGTAGVTGDCCWWNGEVCYHCTVLVLLPQAAAWTPQTVLCVFLFQWQTSVFLVSNLLTLPFAPLTLQTSLFSEAVVEMLRTCFCRMSTWPVVVTLCEKSQPKFQPSNRGAALPTQGPCLAQVWNSARTKDNKSPGCLQLHLGFISAFGATKVVLAVLQHIVSQSIWRCHRQNFLQSCFPK